MSPPPGVVEAVAEPPYWSANALIEEERKSLKRQRKQEIVTMQRLDPTQMINQHSSPLHPHPPGESGTHRFPPPHAPRHEQIRRWRITSIKVI